MSICMYSVSLPKLDFHHLPELLSVLQSDLLWTCLHLQVSWSSRNTASSLQCKIFVSDVVVLHVLVVDVVKEECVCVYTIQSQKLEQTSATMEGENKESYPYLSAPL